MVKYYRLSHQQNFVAVYIPVRDCQYISAVSAAAATAQGSRASGPEIPDAHPAQSEAGFPGLGRFLHEKLPILFAHIVFYHRILTSNCVSMQSAILPASSPCYLIFYSVEHKIRPVVARL
jgi:hypothetical protein